MEKGERLVRWLGNGVAGCCGDGRNLRVHRIHGSSRAGDVAFMVSFILALGSTLVVFGCLNQGADVFWMIPLLGFANSSVYGGFAIYFPELYPTRLRGTGVGFCYNVARYLTALGPLTLGKLVLLFGAIGYVVPLRPAAMCVATIYLAGLFAVPFAPETKGKPLPE